jgi:hypothetical protein
VASAPRLEGADLISAERATALQHQHGPGVDRHAGLIQGGGRIGHRYTALQKASVTAEPAAVNRSGLDLDQRSVDAMISVQNTLYLVFGA